MKTKLASWRTKLRIHSRFKISQFCLHYKGSLTEDTLYPRPSLVARPEYNRDVMHFSRYNCESARFLKIGVFCTDGVTAGYHLPGHCPFAQVLVPMTYHIGG